MKKNIILLMTFIAITIVAQENDQQSQKQSNPMMFQPISVTIGGNFIVTGSFTASKLQRLDTFISTIYLGAEQKALGSLTQIETIRLVSKEIKKYPLRDIILKRTNSEIQKIDLMKFRLTGDFSNNPYLQNDDVIIFPVYDEERNFVEISGGVNKPLKFQFVEGDRLSDALLFAGGINPAYDNITEAEISRLKEKGNIEELIKVKLSDNVILQRGDRIRVLSEENNKLDFAVLVLGEVNKPGKIYIKKEGTTLAEVIANAGGFKPGADLDKAEVVRNYSPIEILKRQTMLNEFSDDQNQKLTPELQLKLKQMSDEYSMARTSNLTIEDSAAFSIDNKLRGLNSEQLVDFNGLSSNSPEAANFLLKDGDVILIPLKFNYVYVFGQVGKVGYVKHDEGKDFKYYIAKSGGLSEEAKDLEDAAIIKGKSRKWITKDKDTTRIYPGDFIYVPKTIRRPFQYYLENIGSIASIVGSVATIILLIIQSGK